MTYIYTTSALIRRASSLVPSLNSLDTHANRTHVASTDVDHPSGEVVRVRAMLLLHQADQYVCTLYYNACKGASTKAD